MNEAVGVTEGSADDSDEFDSQDVENGNGENAIEF